MIKFYDVEIDPKELINRTGRMVTHYWGPEWTRIEISIDSDIWEAPSKISAWIEENLSEGRYGMFYTEDFDVPVENEWEKKYKLIIGFEYQNDALMFKLIGGYEDYKNE